ncbi:hypothetical protein J42TS3_08690 [Paenibacillus vini]|uniref:Uncharacterized protein n=1 Tax=Paenibacillus vini TaxID=1476024 RepID=A0ABQ4M762_9BACL|nr:hypothetical protein J42TS3_08690 [Paenibacillus vini]
MKCPRIIRLNVTPEGKYIVAAANDDGRYELHIRHTNGLGLSSENKRTLLEAVSFYFRDELSLPASAIWVDLPNLCVRPTDHFKSQSERDAEAGVYWK